jgi:hypothetical protein
VAWGVSMLACRSLTAMARILSGIWRGSWEHEAHPQPRWPSEEESRQDSRTRSNLHGPQIKHWDVLWPILDYLRKSLQLLQGAVKNILHPRSWGMLHDPKCVHEGGMHSDYVGDRQWGALVLRTKPLCFGLCTRDDVYVLHLSPGGHYGFSAQCNPDSTSNVPLWMEYTPEITGCKVWRATVWGTTPGAPPYLWITNSWSGDFYSYYRYIKNVFVKL